jgi:hypothetical protein
MAKKSSHKPVKHAEAVQLVSPIEAARYFQRRLRSIECSNLLRKLFPGDLRVLEWERVVARIRQHCPEVPREDIPKMRPEQLVVYLERVWKAENATPPLSGNEMEKDDDATAAKDNNKATVSARMFDLIKDTTTHTWSVRMFAGKLRCSVGAIQKTPAWKELNVAREMVRERRSRKAYRRNLDQGDSQ